METPSSLYHLHSLSDGGSLAGSGVSRSVAPITHIAFLVIPPYKPTYFRSVPDRQVGGFTFLDKAWPGLGKKKKQHHAMSSCTPLQRRHGAPSAFSDFDALFACAASLYFLAFRAVPPLLHNNPSLAAGIGSRRDTDAQPEKVWQSLFSCEAIKSGGARASLRGSSKPAVARHALLQGRIGPAILAANSASLGIRFCNSPPGGFPSTSGRRQHNSIFDWVRESSNLEKRSPNDGRGFIKVYKG